MNHNHRLHQWLRVLALGVWAGCSLPVRAAEALQAPPLQLAPAPLALAGQAQTLVREFRFVGNTVFSTGELAAVTAPYVGRLLTREELEDARRAVTLHYVNHGYINSGAILPDQDVRNGIVTLRVVEGELSVVNVTGNKWLRTSYLQDRLRRWAGTPLQMDQLREGLQLLRQNPNITQINAELKPGALPGESRLETRVTDQTPFRVGLQFDNYRPPSVGSMELVLLLADLNLTGHSDPLEVAYRIVEGGTEGFEFSGDNNIAGSYVVPVTVYDTTVRVFGYKNDYAVIEQPFDVLDIKSASYQAGVTVRQPFYLSAQREIALAATWEWRRSEAELLNQPFDLTPGSVNGVANEYALRLTQDFVDRSFNQVLAARSTFSIGLDMGDATVRNGTDRDGKFFTWLGQLQYVRRLFNTQNLLVFRTDAQFGTQPLLALEQLSIGGYNSVRGYRENQLVRDQGVISSLEVRVPVVLNRFGQPVLQLAPFVDAGSGWNNNAPTPSPRTIASAGIGVLFTPNRHFSAQVYWGYAFMEIDNPSQDPQDYGFLFSVTANLF